MEVYVEVQGTAKALNQGHSPGSGTLASKTRPPVQVCADATVDDAEHMAHDVGTTGEQKPQRERHAQHPLTHRLFREYIFNEEGCTLGHTSSAAAQTEPPTLATERQEQFIRATFTTYTQESVLQTTTLQKCLELLLDMSRQARALPSRCALNAGKYSFVPLLTLGIPGSGTTAILLGALIALLNVSPGPRLMVDEPAIFWSVIISMYIGNLVLLVLNLPLIPYIAKLLAVPRNYLIPFILFFTGLQLA